MPNYYVQLLFFVLFSSHFDWFHYIFTFIAAHNLLFFVLFSSHFDWFHYIFTFIAAHNAIVFLGLCHYIVNSLL